jgi:hypothetical protein
MNIKKRVLITLLLFVTALSVNAQIQRNYFKTLEFFAGPGATLYFGDIGGRDGNVKGAQIFFDNLDIDLWRARPLLTAGLQFSLFKRFTASLQIAPMFLSGSDLRSNKRERDYSFSTFATDIHLQAEYYLANRLNSFSPYVLVGAGEILYSYKASTESKYSKFYNTNTWIFGAGMRFPPKFGISHSIELAYQFANTDMLDGFKDPGSNNDVIFTTTYKVNFELRTGQK